MQMFVSKPLTNWLKFLSLCLCLQKVRGTNIKDMDTSADQGEGLFVTCDIKQGELISFYSGHMVHHSGPHSLHRRKISDSSKIYQQKYDVT